MRRTLDYFRFARWFLLWAMALPSAAGTVVTTGGEAYEGEVSLSPGAVVVHPTGKPATRVPLSRVLRASLRTEAEKPERQNLSSHAVMTRAGSMLVGEITKANASVVILKLAGQAGPTMIPLPDVASMHFESDGKDQQGVPSDAFVPGIVLKTGDFLEAEFRGLQGQRVKVCSLVFGPRELDLSSQVQAVLLRAVKNLDTPYTLGLTNGSILQATSVAIGDGTITVEEPAIGSISVRADQVVEIRAGGNRLASLCDVARARFETAAGVTSAPTLTGNVRLRGRAFDHAIRTAPATTITYDLRTSEGFERLVCLAGLVDGVPTEAKVRFVVQVDGKERYRSEETSACDAAVVVAVPVTNARQLRLTVECTGEVFAGPAVWAEPVLIRGDSSESDGELAATE